MDKLLKVYMSMTQERVPYSPVYLAETPYFYVDDVKIRIEYMKYEDNSWYIQFRIPKDKIQICYIGDGNG